MTMTMSEYTSAERERIVNEFQKLRSIPAVIERLSDVSPTTIKKTLEGHKHLSLPRFPKRSGFTHLEMIDALKAAAEQGATSVDRYSEFRETRPELPSAQTLILRFGSWSAAQTSAGIAARKRTSSRSLKSYSDEAIVKAIKDFSAVADATTTKPTQKAYDSWARQERDSGNDVPLLPTVRARTTECTWADLIRHPEQLIYG